MLVYSHSNLQTFVQVNRPHTGNFKHPKYTTTIQYLHYSTLLQSSILQSSALQSLSCTVVVTVAYCCSHCSALQPLVHYSHCSALQPLQCTIGTVVHCSHCSALQSLQCTIVTVVHYSHCSALQSLQYTISLHNSNFTICLNHSCIFYLLCIFFLPHCAIFNVHRLDTYLYKLVQAPTNRYTHTLYTESTQCNYLLISYLLSVIFK